MKITLHNCIKVSIFGVEFLIIVPVLDDILGIVILMWSATNTCLSGTLLIKTLTKRRWAVNFTCC